MRTIQAECKKEWLLSIFTQQATADLLEVMLLDSASLQESDAKRANRKRASGAAQVEPLYTADDVRATMRQVRALRITSARRFFPASK